MTFGTHLSRLFASLTLLGSLILVPNLGFAQETTDDPYGTSDASESSSSSSASTGAASPATSVESGYQSILKNGLIFGNICANARENGVADTCECRATGNCSLGEVLQVAVNITYLILGISGSIALLMFFWGGLQWVTSQGDSKRVEAGKDTIKHATIGLVIIFGAYAFINFIIATLAGQLPGATIEETISNVSKKKVDSGEVFNSQ